MELRGRLQGLEWLIDEVEASLHQGYEALESYLVDPADESHIRFCLSYIHQVHGSLKIAECHGPLLLAEEMEELAVSMLEGRTQNVVDACDVMVQAMLKLPAYLRQVMTSRRDQPEMLLLLLNELRAVRGESLVSETVFFTPRMDAAQQLSQPYNRQPDPVPMTNLLRKLRQMYQYALLGVVKGEKVEENFGYLDKVFSRLKELSKGLPREPFWAAVLALLEGIAAKEIPLGYSVKMLLRALDGEIRQLAQEGVDGLSLPLPEILLKNILFYIACSRSEAPRAVLVRAAYHLDESLPESLLEDSENGMSPRFHPETAQAIVMALDEELSQVKKCLDRYTIEGGDSKQLLDGAGNGLRRISDSLVVVGRDELRAFMESAREQILAFRKNPSGAEKDCLVLVAAQLVEGETSLHGWLDNNRQLIEGSVNSGEVQIEVNRAQEALLYEAQKGLETMKEAIVEFIASQWQRENLDGMPELMLDVRGALNMMTLPRAAAVLGACHRFLVAEVLAEDNVPNWNTIDALADAITSVECHLEYVGRRDESAEQTILGLAEEGVAKLGYPVEGDVPAVPTTEPEPALLDELQDVAILPLDGDDIDLDILETFIAEADELLEEIDQALQGWKRDWASKDHVESLKRSLRTLKWGARMTSLEQLGAFSHDLESDILVLENKRDQLNAVTFNRLFRQQDYLIESLAIARKLFDRDDKNTAEVDVEVASTDTMPEVQSVLPNVGNLSLKSDMDGPAIRQIERQATRQEMIKVPAPLLDSLVNLAEETSISRGRVEQQVSDFAFTLEEMEATIFRLKGQVCRIGMEAEAHVMLRQEQIEAMSTSETEGFDPLEIDRYSQLQQLSRALLESASDLQDLKGTLADKAMGAGSQLLTQSRINADLQERLRRTRMVPFSRIVPRLRRMVRQVSEELGKKVELIPANVDGEMDRSVMEKMLPSLEHMIRNSIDHGIESSQARLEAGKPEAGIISVGLTCEGGEVLLQLSDDGRGLDIEAIRLRAIELGLMSDDSDLDHQDVIQFIFQSGFSTSQRVTHVSGRGVGMDVVHSQVRKLGGAVQTATRSGEGSQFTIRLPFTVSVNRALMIEVGEDLFALPLNSVDGVVRVSAMELEYYYRYPDARLEYGGERYEVRYLGSLISDELTPKVDISSESALLVLVHSETRSYALKIDGLAGSSEIVVKSLGPQFSKVPGLSGATLLCDGRVVVILDLLALLRVQAAVRVGVEALNTGGGVNSSAVSTVMVVDDSVTVRKVTTRFLERENFKVITARDGIEAMKLLQDHLPDVMLLDIEMPRMDGFEVARRVKGNEEFKNIPIMMIASKTGEKHRDRAFALGVEQYLGKPYQEETLLETISELIGITTE